MTKISRRAELCLAPSGYRSKSIFFYCAISKSLHKHTLTHFDTVENRKNNTYFVEFETHLDFNFPVTLKKRFLHSTYPEVVSNEVVLFGDFTIILLRPEVKKKVILILLGKTAY